MDERSLVRSWSEESNSLPRDNPEFSTLVDEWVQDQFKSKPLPSFLGVFSRVRDKIRDIFPQFSRQQEFESIIKSDMKKYLVDTLEKAIAQENMFIARDEDSNRIIGMVTASKLEKVGGNTPVQGEVVEIGKAFVVPKARGAGVYNQLRSQVVDHVTNKYPGATLLTGTKSEAVKHMSHKAGWKEIPYGDYMRIHGASEEEVALHEPRMKAQGWCGFIYQRQ